MNPQSIHALIVINSESLSTHRLELFLLLSLIISHTHTNTRAHTHTYTFFHKYSGVHSQLDTHEVLILTILLIVPFITIDFQPIVILCCVIYDQPVVLPLFPLFLITTNVHRREDGQERWMAVKVASSRFG